MRVRRAILYLIVIYAMSYQNCRPAAEEQSFDFRQVVNYRKYKWLGDSSVLDFSGGGTISLNPRLLTPGKYTLTLQTYGEAAQGIMPVLRLSLGDIYIKEFSTSGQMETYSVNFEVSETLKMPIRLSFINDYSNSTEDRNAYVYFPFRLRPYKL